MLLDPVDNTVYAPVGPGYPSAIQALKELGSAQAGNVPMALIGTGLGGDCVPADAGYRSAAAWHAAVPGI